MTKARHLIIFDVDGTLVDSQNDIVAAMTAAFSGVGATVPSRHEVLSIVGLSLDVAMARLAPELETAVRSEMVQGYKDAYVAIRARTGAAISSPLYPGAAQILADLGKAPEYVLGVATGKSRRGLDKLIEAHNLEDVFLTQQVADFHPSKPHPSMLLAAMAETDIGPEHTVMIGDTSYDMEMAQAAGIRAIGVNWGYHDRAKLVGACRIVDRFDELSEELDLLLSAEHE
ncbi:MAG: HAD-IA family hydrolase [Paracoccaceae bacterium]